MTPKEKAEELVNKFTQHSQLQVGYMGVTSRIQSAKQCALIAVDECIKLHYNLESDRNGIGESHDYWIEVKQEIEKL